MTGVDFLAHILATGTLHGVGIGADLAAVDAAMPEEHVDVVDEEDVSLRRDYGLIEVFFNDGPDWRVVGASVEIHRLASVTSRGKKLRLSHGVVFPKYVLWREIEAALAKLPDAPVLEVRTDQDGYAEYRSAAGRVSAMVVDSGEGRHGGPGQGDVFSVALG